MLFELLIVHPLKCVCKFSVIAAQSLCVTSVTKFANLMNGDTASCRSMYRLPTGGIRYLKHSRERHRPSEINVEMKSVKSVKSVGIKQENYEKEHSTHTFSGIVQFWMSYANGGVYCPASGRDSSQRAHRLWRDTHLRGKLDRHRLSV